MNINIKQNLDADNEGSEVDDFVSKILFSEEENRDDTLVDIYLDSFKKNYEEQAKNDSIKAK